VRCTGVLATVVLRRACSCLVWRSVGRVALAVTLPAVLAAADTICPGVTITKKGISDTPCTPPGTPSAFPFDIYIAAGPHCWTLTATANTPCFSGEQQLVVRRALPLARRRGVVVHATHSALRLPRRSNRPFPSLLCDVVLSYPWRGMSSFRCLSSPDVYTTRCRCSSCCARRWMTVHLFHVPMCAAEFWAAHAYQFGTYCRGSCPVQYNVNEGTGELTSWSCAPFPYFTSLPSCLTRPSLRASVS
jgi:hypothetical protein